MAYVSKETKAAVMVALAATGAKKEGFSWTVGVRDHMTLQVKIWKYPTWFKLNQKWSEYDSEYGIDLNTYHPHMYFDDTPEGQKSLEWIKKFIAAMNTGNWDKSDVMTDYFNVGFFVSLRLFPNKK